MLPLECDYLTKVAKSQYPEFSNNSEHFNLMRLAKSALLINDIKIKATNYSKNKKTNEKLISHRSTAKNIFNSADSNISSNLNNLNLINNNNNASTASNTQTPGFLKRSSFGTSTVTITGKTSVAKRDSGIKVGVVITTEEFTYSFLKGSKILNTVRCTFNTREITFSK